MFSFFPIPWKQVSFLFIDPKKSSIRLLPKMVLFSSRHACTLRENMFFPCKWQLSIQVFKSRPSKICGRHSLKNLKGQAIPFNFFKSCLPQILLGPFLNTELHFRLWLDANFTMDFMISIRKKLKRFNISLVIVQ